MSLNNSFYSSPEGYDRAALEMLDKECEGYAKIIDRELGNDAKETRDIHIQTVDITLANMQLMQPHLDRLCANYQRRGWPQVTAEIVNEDTIFHFIKDPDYEEPEEIETPPVVEPSGSGSASGA